MEWKTTTTLLEQLRTDGGDAAWRQLSRRFFRPVMYFARRQGLDDADAEDVAQETLSTLASGLRAGRYDRERGKLRQWLFGIAYRKILKAREQSLKGNSSGNPTRFWAELPEKSHAAENWNREWEHALWNECLERVHMEFELISVAAFQRCVRDERTPAEVADELGIPIKSVYNAKHRILKRLRELRHEIEDA